MTAKGSIRGLYKIFGPRDGDMMDFVRRGMGKGRIAGSAQTCSGPTGHQC